MNNIAVVLGSFHKDYMVQMLEKARETANSLDLTILEEVWVPGSMEKPIMVQHLLKKKEIDGIVVLGIIERGETKHGLIMGDAVIQEIVKLQLKYEKPVGVGIIGPEVFPSQIPPRLNSYAEKAVIALRDMLKLLQQA